MASGDRTIAFTEEQLEDLSETFETVLGEKKTDSENWERIPYEILEQILLYVPSYQIPLNKAWVCKRWTNVILQHQFWLTKLERHGLVIDDNIWNVLQEFENSKIVTCLFYASVYQEYCILQTPVPKFLKSIAKGQVRLNGHKKDLLMTSGFLVCRSMKGSILLKFIQKNVQGLYLILKLIAARNIILSVHDHYSFLNFYPRIDYLKALKGCNEAKNLFQFLGCVRTFAGLSFSKSHLVISIEVDENNVCIDPGYSDLIKDNAKVNIHLKAGSNISCLPTVTNGLCTIFVSNLRNSHIPWMTNVVKKFLRPGFLLVFFNYQLDLGASEILLYSMAEAGLDLEIGIVLHSPTFGFWEYDKMDDISSMCIPSSEQLTYFESDMDVYCFVLSFLNEKKLLRINDFEGLECGDHVARVVGKSR